ncbi:MAG TPA: DUF222 domain-containing protein [Jatrophihabitantaceae bacterium]|nr:DUF222 domain-containing protein [Jatrophihabitantaceae bacterium]
MSDTAVVSADEQAHAALAALRAARDEVLGLDLSGCTDDTLLAVLEGNETDRRRAVAVDHRVIAEVDQRGIAAQRGMVKTAGLVSTLLRIDRTEAAGRVAAAVELSPRRALTGEPLEPIFPVVAAASTGGELSATHARIVTQTVDALPSAIDADEVRRIETFLVEQARHFEPRTLRIITRRLLETVDPDGTLSTEADRERRRFFTARQRADGSVFGSYDLDPLAGEALLTVLDTQARPRPADETGVPDERTTGQRNHDAVRDTLMLALRSGKLPACGGVAATILILMSEQQAATGEGLVHTGHGALIPTGTALTLSGEAQVQTVRLGPNRAIEAYSDTQRLFTQQQRLALIARDRGCSVPGCTMPPALCEAHHIVEWATGGRTSVDNGTLLCPGHHRDLPKLGYRCVMLDGVPHWIAPAWLDHDQQPRRNTAHHPELALEQLSLESPKPTEQSPVPQF